MQKRQLSPAVASKGSNGDLMIKKHDHRPSPASGRDDGLGLMEGVPRQVLLSKPDLLAAHLCLFLPS
jgi:hypothetical protein